MAFRVKPGHDGGQFASRRGTAQASFDHLVGTQQECLGYRQPERLGGLQIDDEIELHGLLHRHVGGLCATQDLVDEVGGAAEQVGEICAVGYQPACIDELPEAEDRRDPLLR